MNNEEILREKVGITGQETTDEVIDKIDKAKDAGIINAEDVEKLVEAAIEFVNMNDLSLEKEKFENYLQQNKDRKQELIDKDNAKEENLVGFDNAIEEIEAELMKIKKQMEEEEKNKNAIEEKVANLEKEFTSEISEQSEEQTDNQEKETDNVILDNLVLDIASPEMQNIQIRKALEEKYPEKTADEIDNIINTAVRETIKEDEMLPDGNSITTIRLVEAPTLEYETVLENLIVDVASPAMQEIQIKKALQEKYPEMSTEEINDLYNECEIEVVGYNEGHDQMLDDGNSVTRVTLRRPKKATIEKEVVLDNMILDVASMEQQAIAVKKELRKKYPDYSEEQIDALYNESNLEIIGYDENQNDYMNDDGNSLTRARLVREITDNKPSISDNPVEEQEVSMESEVTSETAEQQEEQNDNKEIENIQSKDNNVVLDEIILDVASPEMQAIQIKKELKEKYPDKTDEEIEEIYNNSELEIIGFDKDQNDMLNPDGNSVTKARLVEKEKEYDIVLDNLVVDVASPAMQEIQIKKALKEKYPEMSDEEIDNLYNECEVETIGYEPGHDYVGDDSNSVTRVRLIKPKEKEEKISPQPEPEPEPEPEKTEEKDEQLPQLQTILNKIKFGDEEEYNMSFKEGKSGKYNAYHAKNIRYRDTWKQLVKTGNVKYDIVNVAKALVGSIGLTFQKLRGKLLREDIKQKYESCQNVIDNLSDKELEVLFRQYKNINSKQRKDIPEAAKQMILVKVGDYVRRKTAPLIDDQKLRYEDLMEYHFELKNIEDKLALGNLSEEEINKLNERKEYIIKEIPGAINSFEKCNQYISDMYSSGLRGIQEDKRALTINKFSGGGMNYEGYGDAKVEELSKEDSVALAEAEEIWKNKNASPEERVEAFHKYHEIFLKNSRIEKKWFGKADTGATSFDPISHGLDYTADTYYRDCMMTAALTMGVISTGISIYTHLFKIPATEEMVRNYGNELTGHKKAFMDGQNQMINQDINNRLDFGERLDLTKAGGGNWSFGGDYTTLDNARHATIQNDYEVLISGANKAIQNGDIHTLGNICSTSQLKYVGELQNNLDMLRKYAETHPQFELDGYIKSLESIANNPNAITNMTDAMDRTIQIGEILANLEDLPSDLIPTIAANVGIVAMAGKILSATENVRKHTDKQGNYICDNDYLAKVTRGEIVPSEYKKQQEEELNNIKYNLLVETKKELMEEIKDIDNKINSAQTEEEKNELAKEKQALEMKQYNIERELDKPEYERSKSISKPQQEKKAEPEVKKVNKKGFLQRIFGRKKEKEEEIIDLHRMVDDEQENENTNDQGPKSM